GRPDVPLPRHVDRLVADEVDRADDVVPLLLLEQVRHPVLTAWDEVGLDAELERRLLADEAAVLVDVVGGALPPEGVLPDVERAAEAVDVLGAAELADAGLAGGVEVALDVGGGAIVGVLPVGAEVYVVVRQHQEADISTSAMTRSAGRVILMFSCGASTSRIVPPIASTSAASSVAAASVASSTSSAR